MIILTIVLVYAAITEPAGTGLVGTFLHSP
jgi:hypothetical protein